MSKKMAKKTETKPRKEYLSPLTADADANADKKDKKTEHKKSRQVQNSQKRARKDEQEDLEEQRLTALLFGSGAPNLQEELGSIAQVDDNTITKSHDRDDDDDDDKESGFVIDKTGEDVELDDEEMQAKSDDENDDSDESLNDGEKDDDEAPAWVDQDDNELSVDIVGTSNRLKKLRKSRDEVAAKALDGDEFERRLRKRYEETTQATARTDWARLEPAKKRTAIRDEDDEEDEAALLASTSAPLLATSQHRLPPNILNIMRCPDANQADPNKAAVQAVHFHPGSNPDQPLLLTAGLDKTLRFFSVGAEKSEKIHGIHFPKMPIYSASFLGDTGNVCLSGRRPFFYMYDAVAGKVDLVPRINGRAEKSWERHVASPDGRIIAFLGNDGYIVLVDAHSKHWIADLKMNGSVRAVTFTPDGKFIIGSGSDGDVYRWDLHSRRCVERFSNNDGTITSALAASSKTMGVGAESGVVNLYSEHEPFGSRKSPLKSIMNLHTSADALRFNHDGQILAMTSKRERHGMKLLHVPTKTVFSNWPTSKTPLNYVWSMDFSPESRFMAIGNDKGKCLLYRLMHYQDE